MGCLRQLIGLLATLAAVTGVNAGVETALLLETQGDCTVRVEHDATPDSDSGTLVFRSFWLVDGISHPCDLTRAQVSASLGRGVAAYRAHGKLKPATSIFVGRISRYPWVRGLWRDQSISGNFEKLDSNAFNALVGSAKIVQPFSDALRVNGLEPGGASCEKLMFHDNGAPLDGLCWILIQPH